MIEIERMTMADVDDIAEVEKRCFERPWSRQSFVNEMENAHAVYFAAKDGGRAIGYAGCWEVSGEGDITNVAVAPEYRRRGVASRLLDGLIKYAAEQEMELLTLEVRKSNIAAQRLYEKFGFKVIGERKRYYSDREDALIMTLNFAIDNG